MCMLIPYLQTEVGESAPQNLEETDPNEAATSAENIGAPESDTETNTTPPSTPTKSVATTPAATADNPKGTESSAGTMTRVIELVG